jgi:hypothetical protein
MKIDPMLRFLGGAHDRDRRLLSPARLNRTTPSPIRLGDGASAPMSIETEPHRELSSERNFGR